MSLPNSIEEAFPPRIRHYLNAASKASNELVCDVVPCWCGAKAGEYCRRSNGEPGEGCSPHADRRTAANRWKRLHPKQWKKLRDETFRRIVRSFR